MGKIIYPLCLNKGICLVMYINVDIYFGPMKFKESFNIVNKAKAQKCSVRCYIGYIETVARLQSTLFGGHLLLAAKSWQKPKFNVWIPWNKTRKVLLVNLHVV